MTKLLYLPTNNYIKFCPTSPYEDYTIILEYAEKFNTFDGSGFTINNIIEYMIDEENLFSENFLERNNLSYPMYKEEFEIIYD